VYTRITRSLRFFPFQFHKSMTDFTRTFTFRYINRVLCIFMPASTMKWVSQFSAFKFTVAYYTAFTATTNGIFSAVQKAGIIPSKLMTSKAMSFFRVKSGVSGTSQGIYSWRHCFKVLWVYAHSISAKMIDLQTVRDCAFFQFICNTVSPIRFSIEFKNTVPFFHFSAGPHPAIFSFIDFTPESFFIYHGGYHSTVCRGSK